MNTILYKVISTINLYFIVFHQRNPHRALLMKNFYMGMKAVYLYFVRLRQYRPLCGQNTYFLCGCILVSGFCCGTNDTENFPPFLEVFLLDISCSFCSRSIASQYDKGTSCIKESEDSLFCEFINRLE